MLFSRLFYKQKHACNDCNKFVTVHFLAVCTENRPDFTDEKIENRRKQAVIISGKNYNFFELYKLHKNTKETNLTAFILCRYNNAIDAHPNSLPQRRKDSLRLFHIQGVEEEERRQCKLELHFPAKKFVAFALTMIIFLSSVVTAVATTIAATIVDDNNTYTIQVLSSKTEDILAQAQVKVGPHDVVTRNDEHGIVIHVRRGYEVNVTAEGKTTPVIMYTNETAAQALEKAKVQVSDKDQLNVPLDQELSEGDKVEVTKQYGIHVLLDGGFVSPVVSEGTVEQALEESGISLNEDDIVTPSPDTPVGDGLVVTVKRVTYRDVTKTEEIPYTTVTKESDTVSQGSFRVTAVGETGEREVVVREKLVDGIVKETKTVSSAVVKQPVAEVKLVAPSKKEVVAEVSAAPTFTDKNGKQMTYKKVLKGKATAYTSNGGRTATGKPAKVGYVAVDPKIIPYGTKLYITSPNGKVVYGYAEAADTGGAMLSGRILVDLYYDTESQCNSFGVRNMLIYVLD